MLTVLVESGKEVTELPRVVEGTVVELAPAIGFEAMVVEEPREDREEVRRENIEDMLFFCFVWTAFLPIAPLSPEVEIGTTRAWCERKKKRVWFEGPLGFARPVAGVRWVVWLM